MFEMDDFEDMLRDPRKLGELEESLMGLHRSVERLIRVIHENAQFLDNTEQILNKLPLLDFYNDDLLRNIQALKSRG